MKPALKLISSGMLLFLPYLIAAQNINVTLTIPPPYSIHAIDYLEFRSQTIVTLTNLTGAPQQVKLIASVSSAKGQKAAIKPSYLPTAPISLAPRETKTLTGNQLKSLNANLSPNDVENSGFNADQIIRTGTLPEGVYQVCVRVHDYLTSAPLSDESAGCALINLTHYDPPIVIQPQNNSMVFATNPQFLNFTWTPAGIPGKTRYELRIVNMTATGLFNPNDAFTGAVLPFFQKSNLLPTTYSYGINDLPLQNGHTYAVEVVAYDPSNSIAFKNGGRSAVTTFTWKKQDIIQMPGDIVIINKPPDNVEPKLNLDPNLNIQDKQNVQYSLQACQENVNMANKNAINGQGVIKVDDVLNIGGHNLLLTEVSWNGKKLSGKGKVTNAWFKIPILVEFSDLEVNSDKVVLTGIAKARDENNSPVKWINDLANVQFGEQEIQNTIAKLMGESDKRIVDWPNTKNIGVGMPVGIRRTIAGAQQLIAIVGMQFSPTGSGLNAVAQINIPSSGQKLSFGASGVCFNPQGLKNDAFLFLAEDFLAGANKPVRMQLLKGDPNNQQKGTYIIFESAGFKQLQLDGKLQLDNAIAKPVNKQLNTVEAPFKIQVENFHNFLLDNISLTPFELVKLPGFEFTVTGISYDHSDAANPQGIIFPSQNYNTEGSLWRGFYFKTLKVKIPAKLQANTEISATNMIFDDKGFSGTLSAPNVFGTDKGQMGERKWPFSMEDLLVRFEKNNMTEGKFKGKIRVPITKDDFFFQYNATLSYVNDLKYQFTIQPEKEVDFPAVIAKASLDPNTHIKIEDVGNGFEPAFHLYGALTLNTALGANLNGYDMSFEGVKVQNLVVDKSGVYLGPDGSIKYNSPQKTLGGFEVSLKGHEIGLNSIGFGLSIDFVGESNVIGGSTAVTILCKWQNNMLRFDKFQLNDVSVEGDMSVVYVNGKLVFYHDDPVYGNGFQGMIKAGIRLGEGGASLDGEIKLLIGRRSNDNLRYFYFDGSIELPEPTSIPLSASMRLFGFRGGVYYHMKREGNTYVPDANTLFGIKAGVGIGLDSRQAFHAKLTLEAAFSNSGLKAMYFDGDGYVFTPFQPGFDPYPLPLPLYIGVKVGFDFENKIFDLTANLSVTYPLKAPLLEGSGQIKIYVAGQNDWYIKAGTPESRLTLKALGGLITSGHYFMAGHIPSQLPPLPQLVKDVCKVQSAPSQRNEGALTNPAALGFAFGADYSGDTGDLEWWIFFARFAYTTGFDVMLYHQNNCEGINGWYATGQAYFAFDGKVGMVFQFRKDGPKRKITLLEAQLGAYAQMGIANPFWFQATVTGNVAVLGIFEGSFSYAVQYGKVCQGNPVFQPKEAFEGISFIKDIRPSNGEKSVSVFARPEVALTFSTNPGKVYELVEQDDKGNSVKRMFRFPIKEMTLREKNSKKVWASTMGANLPGKFKPNAEGTVFIYDAPEAFPGITEMEWIIKIDILEQINGQFVPAKDEPPFEAVYTFITKPAPITIDEENVLLCYPERYQRYYLQNDNVRKGYIQVKTNAYNELFDLKPANQFSEPDKIYVKFVPIGGGATVTGQFLSYQNNRVHFSHPPLLNNRMYVAQFVKVISPQNTLTTSTTPSPNNTQWGPAQLVNNQSLIQQMTQGQKVLNELKLQAREYEIFRYVFRTSAYNTLEAKLAAFQTGTVDNAANNAPNSPRTVSVKGPEAFDEADRKFLTFDWSLGFGFGGQGSGSGDSQGNTQGGQGVSNYKTNFYWKDYLDPYIYAGHNTVLKPAAYPGAAAIQPVTYMWLQNPEPLLSKAEVNAAGNQQMQQGLNFQANMPLKEMKFYLFGEFSAHQHYKNDLIPKLFNPGNPAIAACLNNAPNCNAGLKQLMNYHTANKTFKLLSGGAYQTLGGYNPYHVKGLDGDNRKAFNWNQAMGFKIQN